MSEDDLLSASEKRMLEAINRSVQTTIQLNFSEFERKVTNIENILRESVGRQDSKLLELENDNKELQEKVKELSREKDNLLLEIREKNLIFLGIEEEEGETVEILQRKIRNIIYDVTKSYILPDVFYRIGEVHNGYNRPIRIKFKLLADRNFVFSNRRKMKQPRAIKADTPENIRRDHAILFGQQAELKDQGKPSIINFKKRTLETADGETYCVNDGVLFDPQNKPIVSKRGGRIGGMGRGVKKLKVSGKPFLEQEELEKDMETDETSSSEVT